MLLQVSTFPKLSRADEHSSDHGVAFRALWCDWVRTGSAFTFWLVQSSSLGRRTTALNIGFGGSGGRRKASVGTSSLFGCSPGATQVYWAFVLILGFSSGLGVPSPGATKRRCPTDRQALDRSTQWPAPLGESFGCPQQGWARLWGKAGAYYRSNQSTKQGGEIPTSGALKGGSGETCFSSGRPSAHGKVRRFFPHCQGGVFGEVDFALPVVAANPLGNESEAFPWALPTGRPHFANRGLAQMRAAFLAAVPPPGAGHCAEQGIGVIARSFEPQAFPKFEGNDANASTLAAICKTLF